MKPVTHYTMTLIMERVSEVMEMTPEEIMLPTRKLGQLMGRAMVVQAARVNHGLSLTEIGRFIGKDHATILHCLKSVNGLKHAYPMFGRKLDIVLESTKDFEPSRESIKARIAFLQAALEETRSLTLKQVV